MQGQLLCKECQELEQMIHQCVEAIAANAHEGVQASADWGKEDQSVGVFRHTQHSHELLATRLDALREVLEMHRRHHGC